MRLFNRAAAALTSLAVVALVPAAADAAPALNGTFTPSGQPTYLAQGPDGSVWFSITGSSANKELGEIAPDGTITEYDTPNDRAIVGITAGPATAGGVTNRIWASYSGGVIKWNPATNTGTDNPIATLTSPRDIAPDGAGDIWAVAGDRLVKIKASDGTKIDDVHAGAIGGRDIVLGSDGRMWVADFGSQAITAVNTAGPGYTKQSFPTSVAPQGIAAGPAGQLGIALPNSKMGRITTAGAITETTDNATDAFGTAFGSDGAYWFAQFNSHTLGRLTPTGGYTRPISLPAGAGPRHIATGPNKTLWVSGETSKKIYRITGVTPPPPPKPPAIPPANPPATPPTGAGDRAKPAITAARLNVARRRLTMTLDEAASLRLRVDQRLKGRKRAGKCRKPRRNAKPNCRYWKKRRTATAEGTTGVNRIPLGRRFKRGSYRLVVRATDRAGNASTKTIKFTVKSRKR